MSEDLHNIDTILRLMNRVDLKGSEAAQFVKAQQWLAALARKVPAPAPAPAPEGDSVD